MVFFNKKLNFFCLILVLSILSITVSIKSPLCILYAQDNSASLSYKGDSNYTLVERTNLRRYDNDKYTGLVSREVRSFITNVTTSSDRQKNLSRYDGNFYVYEQTKSQSRTVAAGIQEAVPSIFVIDSEGKLLIQEDHGYPSFRSFPAYPSKKVNKGDSWQASAERVVDPLNKGIFTHIPMLIEYTYEGTDILRGQEVHKITAKWASRYGLRFHIDYTGDPDLKEAQGSHKAILYISAKNGCMIQANDIVDEYFIYSNGQKVSFKGTINLFTEYPPAIDRSKIITALQRVASIEPEKAKELEKKQDASVTPIDSSKSGGVANQKSPAQTGETNAISNAKNSTSKNGGAGENDSHKTKEAVTSAVSQQGGAGENLSVENTESGIRLTMQNLQFKPDSAELLPGEDKRLDQIASILKEVPDCLFLIEGHTASTGNPTGEQTLSEERAKTIASSLAKRGISLDRFICKGSGGRKPVADNSTPQGKAKNRRVEITILE